MAAVFTISKKSHDSRASCKLKKPLYFQYQRKSQRFDRNKKKRKLHQECLQNLFSVDFSSTENHIFFYITQDPDHSQRHQASAEAESDGREDLRGGGVPTGEYRPTEDLKDA